ncbi:hypothetical protein FSP39_005461 [Pinctada imbricata]|uniref:BTB domain-containing protein n=1 Tax=Pinctada imbricata TaxID=66713 RepID=A0AA88XQ91_PINIB|nr:hypothetical protein FSP39_005461 [Pinctada imbricata]
MDAKDREKFIIDDPNYGRELLRNLNSLRHSNMFTDATLYIQHEELYCHRNILAASSPYFRAMFTHNLREGTKSEVQFEDVSPWTLKRIIDYVYTGKLEITIDNAQELLAAGSRFEYPAIVNSCCDFLEKHLHPSNCLGIEYFTQMYACDKLMEKAHKYALENFSGVVECEEFLEMSIDRLLQYLASDWIDVRTEETVYDAVMQWIDYDMDKRKDNLFDLLSQVRLPIIQMNNLKVMAKHPLIRNYEDCLQLVMEAQEQHESIHDQYGRRRRSMQNSQVHPRPSTVAKEKLVVVGGYHCKNVEMYDPVKEKWFDLPEFPKIIIHNSVSVVANSIIVTGGILENSIIPDVWKFDSVKRTWQSICSMLKPRARHASGILNDRLFVIGGITYDSHNSVVDIEAIESYDFVTNTWSVVGHSPFPRQSSRVFSHGDALVEVGGMQGGAVVNTIDSYLLSDNGHMKSTGEQFILPEPIQNAQIIVINGIFYIIWEDTKKMIALNPQKRTFQQLSDMHFVHKQSGATVLGEKLYITGGLVDSRASSTVECYDPVTDTWTVEPMMSEPHAFHGCVTLLL